MKPGGKIELTFKNTPPPFFVLFAGGLFSWHFRTYNLFKTFWGPNFTCERTTGDSDGDEAFGNVIDLLFFFFFT